MLALNMTSRKGIQDFARIMELIILFEKSQEAVFHYKYKTAVHYLSKNYSKQKYERIVLRHLNKLKNTAESNAPEVLGSLKKQLTDHKISNGVLGMEELLYWIESRLQNRSIKDIFVESRK